MMVFETNPIESISKEDEIDLEDGEIEDDEELPQPPVIEKPITPPKPAPPKIEPPIIESPSKVKITAPKTGVSKKQISNSASNFKNALNIRNHESQYKPTESVEDDWADNVEKAIRAAMGGEKEDGVKLHGDENGDVNGDGGDKTEGAGDVVGEDRKLKKKKRKKKHRGEDDAEDRKDSKRRKKHHHAAAEGNDDFEGGMDDDDEMLFVRGASPIMRDGRERDLRSSQSPPPQLGYPDDPYLYPDEMGPGFDDLYDSYDDDSDLEADFHMEQGDGGSPRRGGFKRRGRGGMGMRGKGGRNMLRSREHLKKRKRMMMQQQRHGDQRQGADSVCIFFMQGKCQKGDDCPYSHDAMPPRKMELCKFYLMDCCAKKDKCLYMHHDFPCKYHHTGLKCFAGDRCKFNHGPLTEVLKSILLRHLETAPKEILGDFPRLSREGAAQMVHNKKNREQQGGAASSAAGSAGGAAAGGGAAAAKPIPSLFDIEIAMPAGMMLEGREGEGGSPGRRAGTPMPSDDEDTEVNNTSLSPAKSEARSPGGGAGRGGGGGRHRNRWDNGDETNKLSQRQAHEEKKMRWDEEIRKQMEGGEGTGEQGEGEARQHDKARGEEGESKKKRRSEKEKEKKQRREEKQESQHRRREAREEEREKRKWGDLEDTRKQAGKEKSSGAPGGGGAKEWTSTALCYRCGKKGHIRTDPSCPALGQKCHKCGGGGHYAKLCLSGGDADKKMKMIRSVYGGGGGGMDDDDDLKPAPSYKDKDFSEQLDLLKPMMRCRKEAEEDDTQSKRLHRLAGYSGSPAGPERDVRPPTNQDTAARPPANQQDLDEDKEGLVMDIDERDEPGDHRKASVDETALVIDAPEEEGDEEEKEEAGEKKMDVGDGGAGLEEASAPNHLPKKQQELFLRIQQQQQLREQESKKNRESLDEGRADEAAEEKWYSSDEEDDGASLTSVLQKLSSQPAAAPRRTTGPTAAPTAADEAAEMQRRVLTDLARVPDVNDAVNKLLSTIGIMRPAMVTSQQAAEEKRPSPALSLPDLPLPPIAARDPRVAARDPRKRPSHDPVAAAHQSPTPEASTSASTTRARVDPRSSRTSRRSSSSSGASAPSIYSSIVLPRDTDARQTQQQHRGGGDVDLRDMLRAGGAARDVDLRRGAADMDLRRQGYGDMDLRMRPDVTSLISPLTPSLLTDPSAGGDVDLRRMLGGLPFKPVPVHEAATEIDASFHSHPPIAYRVVTVTVPTPDYSRLKLNSAEPMVRTDPRLRKLFKIPTSSPTSPPAPSMLSPGGGATPTAPARADPRRPARADPPEQPALSDFDYLQQQHQQQQQQQRLMGDPFSRHGRGGEASASAGGGPFPHLSPMMQQQMMPQQHGFDQRGPRNAGVSAGLLGVAPCNAPGYPGRRYDDGEPGNSNDGDTDLRGFYPGGGGDGMGNQMQDWDQMQEMQMQQEMQMHQQEDRRHSSYRNDNRNWRENSRSRRNNRHDRSNNRHRSYTPPM